MFELKSEPWGAGSDLQMARDLSAKREYFGALSSSQS